VSPLTHYGTVTSDALCESAAPGDFADTDMRDVNCKRCRELRRDYLIAQLDGLITLGLCEQDKLILRPNQLYMFTVMENCSECRDLAAVYAGSAKQHVGAEAKQLSWDGRGRRCGIPARTLPPCDLEWGHDGDMHCNGGDGFYARDYEVEHHARQCITASKKGPA
jgi:hypothetical protein